MKRALGLTLAAALLLPSSAAAHASLVRTEPAESTRLGASPTVVRLSFSERPDAALSRVRVLDAAGRERQSGPATPVAGDARTLGVPVPPLLRGSYTVSYRAVAADDGHATEGSFSFGVRAAAGAAAPVPVRPGSPLELPARTPNENDPSVACPSSAATAR